MSKAIVTIAGRCGRDAEPVNSSTPMARLSLPSSTYREGEERTTWWNVTVWGRDAEFCLRNVKKGDIVLVSGEAYMHTYTDNGGIERQKACIDSRTFNKIASATPPGGNGGSGSGSGSSGSGSGSGGGGGGRSGGGWGESDDPVPF